MMKTYKQWLAAMMAGMLVIGLAGCEKEGPAEEAGKAMDEAAADAADQAEEMKETLDKKMAE